MGSFAYAAWTSQVTTFATLNAADPDIEILNCWVQQYNGQGYSLFFTTETVTFSDLALFPGWTITIITQIHNTAGSYAVEINYTLYYSYDGIGWTRTDETELLNRFRIVYKDGFYWSPGADGIWCTPDDEPFLPGDELWPCQSVYKIETLFFDAQDHPELQDTQFHIMVKITATYPQT